MSAGDRFINWVESAAAGWSGRLAGWMIGWFSGGITRFIEAIEPEGLDFVEESLAQVEATPEVPQNIRNLVSKIRRGGKPIPLFIAIPIAVILILPVLQSLFAPIGRILSYLTERLVHSGRIDPQTAVRANFRGLMEDDWLIDTLRDLGYAEKDIETIRNVLKFYPGPQDLVTMQAHEVFEAKMRTKYGLDDEFGNIDLEPFRKAGMTDEITSWYWRSHWQHASWNQVVEMLHRGQLEEDDVRDWFRLVEIPPFWRDKLIATSWNVPTRVDVRRFYDLRTIDELRLREIYTAMGYHDKDLDDYVLWTKIYVEFPDLLSRWKNGWISLEDVRRRLTELGMSSQAAEELIQTKVQAEGASRTAAERDLTKADIYKGVKDERISRLEGLELLMDLGYDEDEASYILDIYAPNDETVSAVQERQLTKTDVRQGLKTGVINQVEARQKLLELRYTPADVEFLIRLFNAVNFPPEEIKLKEASKADIVLGVTRGLISPQEGHAMLLDIGYDPAAADFILTVRATESPFSPADINEFKDLTTKWRRSAGMVTLPVPDELREAARELVRIDNEVKSLELAVGNERRQLTDEEAGPAAATKKLKELQVALNRARAEQERIKVNYDGLVAAWKQGQEGK